VGALRQAKRNRAKVLAERFRDFRKFCGLLQIQPKEGGGRIRLRMSSVQRAYDRKRTSRDIVLKARQVHLTTVECARDVWWFLTRRGARVVVVVQSQEDQAPLHDVSYKIQMMFDALRGLGLELPLGTESTSEWSLPHRDATLRIIQAGASKAAAQKKGRAGTVNRLHITEAAFFEFADETFNGLIQSVPQHGSEIVIETTPNGAAGWFFEQWQMAKAGQSDYTAHFFPWFAHDEYRIPLEPGEVFETATKLEETLLAKGVSPQALKWYRWKLRNSGGNANFVEQEFPSDEDTCFLVTGRGFFDQKKLADQIRAAEAPTTTRDFRESGSVAQRDAKNNEVPTLRVWYNPEPRRLYVVVLDTSEGIGKDAGSAIVYERGSGRHMATLWGQFKPRVLAKHARWLAIQFNRAEIVVERNNHGGTVLAALQAEHYYDNVWEGADERPGFNTTPQSRPVVLDTFEQAHREGHFDTKDAFLLGEMRTFIVPDNGKPQAAPRCHDDLVIPAAIGWWVICQPMRRRSAGAGTLPVA
jgi:hypothetical protein